MHEVKKYIRPVKPLALNRIRVEVDRKVDVAFIVETGGEDGAEPGKVEGGEAGGEGCGEGS